MKLTKKKINKLIKEELLKEVLSRNTLRYLIKGFFKSNRYTDKFKGVVKGVFYAQPKDTQNAVIKFMKMRTQEELASLTSEEVQKVRKFVADLERLRKQNQIIGNKPKPQQPVKKTSTDTRPQWTAGSLSVQVKQLEKAQNGFLQLTKDRKHTAHVQDLYDVIVSLEKKGGGWKRLAKRTQAWKDFKQSWFNFLATELGDKNMGFVRRYWQSFRDVYQEKTIPIAQYFKIIKNLSDAGFLPFKRILQAIESKKTFKKHLILLSSKVGKKARRKEYDIPDIIRGGYDDKYFKNPLGPKEVKYVNFHARLAREAFQNYLDKRRILNNTSLSTNNSGGNAKVVEKVFGFKSGVVAGWVTAAIAGALAYYFQEYLKLIWNYFKLGSLFGISQSKFLQTMKTA